MATTLAPNELSRYSRHLLLPEVVKAGQIVHSEYGTRCSTILLNGERTRYAERAFAPDGTPGETRHYEF